MRIFRLDRRVAACNKKDASHAAISIDVMVVGEKPFKGAATDANGDETENNSKPLSVGALGGFII